jgi:TetR/AcrR family transcriptional regulator, transcriptional repressor for nem operon
MTIVQSMPPSSAPGEARATLPGKRERLVAAASELLYRQGVERTTLADIAQAAEVPLGNVYYYFKAKDDIVAAVVQTHMAEIESTIAALERRHRSPKARLKALVGMVAEQRDAIAQYGCPYGTLCSELTKRPDDGSRVLATGLMGTLLGWAEQQFAAVGRRDASDLAVELLVTYQGSAVVASALGDPELMARQARRLHKWIDAVAS